MDNPDKSITSSQFICVRIDMAPVPKVPLFNDGFWTRILTLVLNASLRGRGVLFKEFALRDAGHAPTAFSGGVITRHGESLGLFEVTDWVAASNAICTELDALKILHCSKVGRNTEDGGPWYPVYPKESLEDFQTSVRRLLQWAKEVKAAPAQPPSFL